LHHSHPASGRFADSNGTWNSDIRYTAFGEIRLKTGVTSTGYRYTGQLDMQGSIGNNLIREKISGRCKREVTRPDTIDRNPFASTKGNNRIVSDGWGHVQLYRRLMRREWFLVPQMD